MRVIKLSDLPDPPHGKIGWPWTEGSEQLPERMSSGHSWPKISVITPSYNYDCYIEEAIRSVLLQGYPNLEYIIIDGGSSDGTCSIINKYRKWIDFFVSEKDSGLTDALLKGFDNVTGEWVGWQNADDFYARNAFYSLGNIFDNGIAACDIVHGVTYLTDDRGASLGLIKYDDAIGLDDVQTFPLIGLANQSLLISFEMLREHGFVDRAYSYAMDSELMTRLIASGAKTQFVPGMEGMYRIHGNALTFRGGLESTIESCRICEYYIGQEGRGTLSLDVVMRGYLRLIVGLYRGNHIEEFNHHSRVYLKNRLSCGLIARCLFALLGRNFVANSSRIWAQINKMLLS